MYDVFIAISWLFHIQGINTYHFVMTVLSAHVALPVLSSTFQTLSKLAYSTYFKILWGKMNLFSWDISNRIFLNLHLVVVTVIITLSLSLILRQHKARFLFQNIEKRNTFHFISAFSFAFLINCPDILGKFHTGFSLPCNPYEWLVSNYPLQYHLLIKHLGHTDKRDDHQLKKVLIIKKIINYHHQHLKRKCMGNSMENMNTVWCNQLGEKGLGNV